MAGLKPNDFYWVIEGKLAVSECIGGGGLTARKIRREEEIQWLKSQGINSIFSLLESDFNLTNYQEVGFRTYHFPLGQNTQKESIELIFEAIKEALSDKDIKLLIHREYLDEDGIAKKTELGIMASLYIKAIQQLTEKNKTIRACSTWK